MPEIVGLEADGGGDEGGAGVGVGVDAAVLPGTETPEQALSVNESNTIVTNGA